jgi:hypothetical protein
LGAWRVALANTEAGRADIERAAQAFQAQFKANGVESPFWIGAVEEERYLPDAERAAYQLIVGQLADLRRNPLPDVEYAHGVRELLGPGDSSPRGVPRSLGGPAARAINSGSGRVDLAQWLTGPEQTRPARAWVNRVWSRLMGAPLSQAPGRKGNGLAEPVLAALAKSFQTDMGGSTKALVRLIVHSHAYHQVSTPMAGAPGWTQQAPRRLSPAEVRDIALFAVGRLAPESGGPAEVRPEAPRRSLYLARYRSEEDGKPIGDLEEQRLDAVAKVVAEIVLATSRPDGRSRVRRAFNLLVGRDPKAAEAADGLRRLGEAALRSGGKSELAWAEYAGYLLRNPGVRIVR